VRLNRELQILPDSGCKVAVIIPDAASVRAFERSGAEESRNTAVLRAAKTEGRGKAGEIARLFSETALAER
jgi:hypothetical protein